MPSWQWRHNCHQAIVNCHRHQSSRWHQQFPTNGQWVEECPPRKSSPWYCTVVHTMEKYGKVLWRNMVRCVPPGNMISPPAGNLIVRNQKKYEAAGVSQFIREREGVYCSILAHCHSAGCHYQVTRDCFSTKSPTLCLSCIIFSFPWISILSSLDFYFAFCEFLFFSGQRIAT